MLRFNQPRGVFCCCFVFVFVLGFEAFTLELYRPAISWPLFPCYSLTVEGIARETEGPGQHKEDDFWKQKHSVTSQLGNRHERLHQLLSQPDFQKIELK